MTQQGHRNIAASLTMPEFEAVEDIRWRLRLTKSEIVRESLRLFADVTKRALNRVSNTRRNNG